jgi:pimeloyl-ACP methyl ester carboxylesterase
MDFPALGSLTVRLGLMAVLGLLAAGPVALAQSLPAGSNRFVLPNLGEPIEVFTHKPASYRDGPLIVVIHGSDRNAEEYRNYAIPLAERFHALVVAPLFDAARFDDERYKRGGGVTKAGRLQPREQWTFNVITRLVAEVRRREGRPDLPYYVIGHSGGAQFTARMAMYLPGDARRFVAANAGSYTFPDPGVKFPYGLGGLPPELADDDTLRRYLAAPLTLYLGTGDVLQLESDGFDFSLPAMQQGPHRLARGHHFFDTMQSLAARRGWTFNWRLVETPGIAHSGEKMFRAAEVGDALFGPEPAGPVPAK